MVMKMVKKVKNLGLTFEESFKRGLYYRDRFTGQIRIKKCLWKCEICGKVFIWRGQAEECETNHYRRYLENLAEPWEIEKLKELKII